MLKRCYRSLRNDVSEEGQLPVSWQLENQRISGALPAELFVMRNLSKNVHTELSSATPSVPSPELALDHQFFENLDRIDRAMQTSPESCATHSTSRSRSLVATAPMLHPLDPDATLFEIPMERTVSRYPSP